MATERRVPDDGELLALLNSAFDGWGSERYFAWKYTDFPDYEPATDNFVVRNDAGQVVAARRIFRKRLQTPEGPVPVHVHGGTAVHEDYRGRGHYTELLERSMAYSRQHAEHVITFNRAGKITTEHHRKNGWRYLTLPVYSKVLSPSRVLAHYVLDDDVARRVAGYAAKVDRQVTRSGLVSRALATVADAIYGDSAPAGAEGGAPAGDELPPTVPEVTCDVETVDGRELSDELAEKLYDRLGEELEAPYRFERSAETLRHAGRYPEATVYVARDGTGNLRSFLVAGYLRKEELVECRIVEQTWGEPAATRRLFERVESDARRAGADVVIACSRRRPAPGWVGLGTEYMMWPPDVGSGSLSESAEKWRLTAYDVL
jgi:GNAT superfamily N-acetyltransferase